MNKHLWLHLLPLSSLLTPLPPPCPSYFSCFWTLAHAVPSAWNVLPPDVSLIGSLISVGVSCNFTFSASLPHLTELAYPCLKNPFVSLNFLLAWPNILKNFTGHVCHLSGSLDCQFHRSSDSPPLPPPYKGQCLPLIMCSVNISQINEWKNQVCRTCFTSFKAPQIGITAPRVSLTLICFFEKLHF